MILRRRQVVTAVHRIVTVMIVAQVHQVVAVQIRVSCVVVFSKFCFIFRRTT
jgi:hypothetical protein